MKKYRVTVPTIVSVSIVIEAEDEYDAREKTEDMDFGLEHSVNMGGGLSANTRDMDLDCSEADYDNVSVHEDSDSE